jgi:type IV secretion system protein TrbE
MLSLKKYKSTEPGFADLLNYAALIDEGIVQGKDGSLLAGFFFCGKDSATATNAERNYDTAMVSTYLSKFDSGWSIWVEAVRLPSPGYTPPDQSFFPDPITALIDAERREMFERLDSLYETEHVMLIQYLPPLRRSAKVGEMFYSDTERDETAPGNRVLAEFKKRLTDFQEGLKDILHPKRMGSTYVEADGEFYESDQLVNYLHFCLTGDPVALRIPSCPMFMDSWIGVNDLWTGNIPKTGDKFIACVSIDGFPEKSRPGILSMLEGLPVAYRWSSRFIYIEGLTAIERLKRFRKHWQQKVRGFWSQLLKTDSGVVDIDAVAMTRQVDQALGDARSDTVAHGDYSSIVVLMGESRSLLMEQAAYVKKEIERRGFGARVESVNAQEAWHGSLPGHTYPNVRRPFMHTLSVATLLPLSAIWPGLRENPCEFYPAGSPPLMHAITTGSTPFRVNVHVDDNGHVAVFGPVGAGKSTLLAIMAAQFRRYRSRPRADGSTVPATVAVFDNGNSMYTLCKAIGGHHYDMGDTSGLVLCPLADLETENDILWAAEWVATCYMLQKNGERLAPAQKSAVNRALGLMKGMLREERSLTEFVATVQDEEVQAAMRHYILGGAMGHLLDGAAPAEDGSNFVVYEIGKIMKLDDQNSIPVLMCLIQRFEKSLTGQPAMLIIDEGWMILKNALGREFLEECCVRLRKENCSIVFATQSLSAVVKSGLLDVIIEQCATKILLPNYEADAKGTDEHPGPHEFYTVFGLNDREIQVLKTAQYKKQYYYKSPLGRRMFELGLGPLALSFVAVSDKDTLRDVRACEASYGNDWPIHWLKKRGVDYAKYAK